MGIVLLVPAIILLEERQERHPGIPLPTGSLMDQAIISLQLQETAVPQAAA